MDFNRNAFNYQQNLTPIGEICWVENKEQIKNVFVPANQSRVFFSKAIAEFYLVTTDKMGIMNISTYTFTEKKEIPVEDKYVTQDKLKDIIQQTIEELLGGKTNESNVPKSK